MRSRLFFFRGKEPKKEGAEKKVGKRAAKKSGKSEGEKAGRLQSGQLQTGQWRTGRDGQGGIGVFPEKIFGNTLAKKPDFGYNKKKATAGKRAGGRN